MSSHQAKSTLGSLNEVKTGRPLVSVIMSMRNNATTVGAAMRSVQLQTLSSTMAQMTGVRLLSRPLVMNVFVSFAKHPVPGSRRD